MEVGDDAEFQDAVDDQIVEQGGQEGPTCFTDAEGYEYEIPK